MAADWSTKTASIQIHGIENLRVTLKLTMRIEDWRKIGEIISDQRQALTYSDYSEFVRLIGDLLRRVEKDSFVAELNEEANDEKKAESPG